MTGRLLRVFKPLGFLMVGVVLAGLAGEGIVRLNGLDQNRYIIEIWRFARELSIPSDDPAIGHELEPNKSLRLQGVEVTTNSLGLRGPELLPQDAERHRIVIIGDSISFGWGLSDADSLRGQLSQRLGEGFEVVNTGVPDMNLAQVVAHWLKVEGAVSADTVLLVSSMRATAEQAKGHAGWLVRHSQLAVLVSAFWQNLWSDQADRDSRVAALKERWLGEEGQGVVAGAMDRLKRDQKAKGYRVLVAQAPEPHDFKAYGFGVMGDVMRKEARERDWTFIDLFPLFEGKEAKDFWVSGDDPHPNARAISLIADKLALLLGK